VGQVGIDGIAGPSELVVVASSGADPGLIASDLMAQAEHGADSPVWCLSPDAGLLDAVAAALEGGPEGEAQLIHTDDLDGALVLSEQIAPEHLELIGEEAEALAPRVRNAGCLFVGAGAATAFGDYVAGSNHVLPTGGAARFQSALSPATFRRRMSRVSLPPEAAARLAPAGAALARAEGFPVHAESMERRA
jgi:histidinol dehydrogenase